MQIKRGTMLEKFRFSGLNPMPASTLSLSQGLWIWPLASSDHGVFCIVFVGDGGRGFGTESTLSQKYPSWFSRVDQRVHSHVGTTNHSQKNNPLFSFLRL
jgi:hypothetical protein